VKGGKPPHELLGVAADASEKEIRRAYQAKMREYHPDKVANAASELRDLAEKRSKEINGAYEAMMKPFAS
jgi:curved DNA-binding protein CbpA